MGAAASTAFCTRA